MSEKSDLNRRSFFKTGLGVAGAFIASRALAETCRSVTSEQPLGPFFPNAGTPQDPIRENNDQGIPIHLANDNDLTFIKGRGGQAKGQVVYIKGLLTDEACEPISNGTIVIWQASSSGRYNHRGDADNQDFAHPVTGKIIKRVLDPSFQYWGQAVTNERGEYRFKTIIPGFYPADLQNKWYRPPHIHFLASATGQPQFVTQMYFKGQDIEENDWIQELNRRDFLLQNSRMSTAEKEALVIDFKRDTSGKITDGLVGRFDITLPR